MLVRLDNGAPRGLARLLDGHSVEGARVRGWEELAKRRVARRSRASGLRSPGDDGQNIRYQQNLKARKISLVVLEHSQWPRVKLVADKVVAAVNTAHPGSYVEVEVPFKDA